MTESGVVSSSRAVSERTKNGRSLTVAGLVIAVACAVLLGWQLQIESLKRVIPGFVAMNPATAMAFILAGTALGLQAWTWSTASWPRHLARGLAGVVTAVGGLRLLAYAGGWELGIDQILFARHLAYGGAAGPESAAMPSRMAPNTAVLFVLSGLALCLAGLRSRRARIACVVLALMTAMLALTAMIGYINGVTGLYQPSRFIPIALPTAICFVVLAGGVLMLRSDRGQTNTPLIPGFDDTSGQQNIASLQRKITLGFGVALFLLTVIGVVSFASIRNYLIDNQLQAHTRQVIATIAQLSSDVKDAETGVRGYIITGQDRFLDPYHGAIADIGPRSDLLRSLTADNPDQQANLDVLMPLINRNLELLKENITTRQDHGVNAAQAMMTIGRGKQAMDAVRVAIQRMEDLEDHLLVTRLADTTRSAWMTICVITIGSLLAFGLVGGSGWLIRRDMAARGKIEEQLHLARDAADRANQTKSEFLANMSHEIRTPMTAIIGYADLLLDPTQTVSDRLDYVNIIRRNGDHLLTVINDVLDLSKIEAGKPMVDLVECSPCRVLSDLASLLRVRAVEKGLSLEVTSEGMIPTTIRTDPTRLRQILINLVSNAIKFTPKGWIRLVMSLEEQDGRPVRMRFDVIDTGIGISADEQMRLFQPFAQADNSTTRCFGGTGLGLTISKRLAEMLDGEICVDSSPGRGSTFTLRIGTGPLDGVARVANCSEVLAGTDAPSKPMPLSSLHGRILIVDDGIDNRQLLSVYLRRAGAEVTMAENGRIGCDKALAAWAAGEPFDLILMDMQMPVLDGYGATARLRAKGYTGPIIALTAHAMADDRDKCLKAGCTDYLSKPIRRDDLLLAISHHLSRRHESPQVTTSVSPPPPPLHSDLGESDVEPFLDTYIRELPVKVAYLQAYLAADEKEPLAQLVHQLRGTGGFYGFMPISTAAAAVNESIQNHASAAQIARGVQDLIQTIRRVEGYDRDRETLPHT